ncbi:MAG: OmpH family outer membrane protein, partial [Bacteroidia bacterium]|nr:OmpH family outer membrane protein [Bacteroidia bacterium]
NLDSLNERSLYVDYMTKKLRRSQASIEGSLENLSMQYQKKMEEYQTSASAGIAPESELAAKAKEIQKIETDAKNKQMQMDNLMMEMNDKKMEFQEEVRAYIKENYATKYDYVFTYSETVPIMLYGSPSAEITSEVIYALNEKFKAKQASNKK